MAALTYQRCMEDHEDVKIFRLVMLHPGLADHPYIHWVPTLRTCAAYRWGLLQREDGVVWVDIPVCDPIAAQTLAGVFGFHRMAVRDCAERNHVSKVHVSGSPRSLLNMTRCFAAARGRNRHVRRSSTHGQHIAQQALKLDVDLVFVRSAHESLQHARQRSRCPLKVDHLTEELVDASRDSGVTAEKELILDFVSVVLKPRDHRAIAVDHLIKHGVENSLRSAGE